MDRAYEWIVKNFIIVTFGKSIGEYKIEVVIDHESLILW